MGQAGYDVSARCRSIVLACVFTCLLLLLAGRVLAELSAERVAQLYGPQAERLYREWQQQLLLLRREPSDSVRLREVNQFFNKRIRFADDMEVWHQVDYWATPLETMSRAAGDCEDFTIAKYFTLRELGMAADKLRLTYVKAHIGAAGSPVTQAHMVLAYYATPVSEPLILDNLIGTIRPASQRPDLTPVFSFNTDSIWAAGSTSPNGSADRMTRWRQLLDKMHSEGFLP